MSDHNDSMMHDLYSDYTMMDASDYYVVPVFGGFGIPVSVPPSHTSGNGYLSFRDAYGHCSTVTYVKRSLE